MGATFKGATIDTLYAKFHESFGDIMVKMNPASSKGESATNKRANKHATRPHTTTSHLTTTLVTGTIDMKHGDARAVATFDKDHPNFITKVALTSDKIAMGTMKVVLKPTYNAITKVSDRARAGLGFTLFVEPAASPH